ncbi:hypothetical protein D030_1999 [Vibrio parahaemolyticus AQ3810]|nr:hypothetical protein D030_1999 [Vibrio parahaemolyticus AQ3810]
MVVVEMVMLGSAMALADASSKVVVIRFSFIVQSIGSTW